MATNSPGAEVEDGGRRKGPIVLESGSVGVVAVYADGLELREGARRRGRVGVLNEAEVGRVGGIPVLVQTARPAAVIGRGVSREDVIRVAGRSRTRRLVGFGIVPEIDLRKRVEPAQRNSVTRKRVSYNAPVHEMACLIVKDLNRLTVVDEALREVALPLQHGWD